MDKGNLDIDPRGLIFESYRMDGISLEQCRSIFLDWALGVPEGADMDAALQALKAEYVDVTPKHPMNGIILEGLSGKKAPKRRRGRSARH